ncbi:MAG: sulfatase-like hydrolase/transferase [Opitutaceae bacterium]|nr:sulfatase-like hydrolase/transferase [Opitutaceae bacterium]
MVIFVGDNGTGGDGKGTACELGARVPFIVRGAGVKRGVVSRALGDVTDLLPTLAEFAGAQLPKGRLKGTG